jgi:hypothetical protein
LVDRLDNWNYLISHSDWSIGLHTASSTSALLRFGWDLDDFLGLAVVAAKLLGSCSVFESQLQFTQETDNLVAIIALFRLERDLFTNHAATFLDELFLEFTHLVFWGALYVLGRVREGALTQNAINLMIALNQIVAIQFG